MTIFRPSSTAELRDVIAWASAEEQPLELIGGGSKRALGRPLQVDHSVELGRLSGIRTYEPAELVLTAGAATPMDEIEAALAANGQMMAFEPVDWRHLLGAQDRQQTLGGVLACNIAGPRRIRAGAARDHFLGFQGVNGRGEIFKAGGQVVKNVTGYDLPKLLAGSYGTLAALSEVTIKVLPRPETELTLAVMGMNEADAILSLADALNSPHEVSAAAHLPADLAMRSGVPGISGAGTAVTLVRIEGPGPSVAYRAQALQSLLRPHGEIAVIEAGASVPLWREIGEARLFSDGEPIVWRLSVAPGTAPRIAAEIRRARPASIYFDWGGGLIWVGIDAVSDGGAAAIRRALGAQGGHATLIRAPESLRAAVPVFEPLEPGLAQLTSRVKDSFDPRRVLNPGRMYAGL